MINLDKLFRETWEFNQSDEEKARFSTKADELHTSSSRQDFWQTETCL